jgi:hypothetical protein
LEAGTLYNALQLAFCCIISCIRESCIEPASLMVQLLEELASCRRSCWRTLPAVWTMLLPLGNGHRRAELLECWYCTLSSSLRRPRRSAPHTHGSRLCSTSSAAHGVAPLPRSASTTWVTAILHSVCWLAIWTSALACAALTTMGFQLALPLPMRSGTSLRGLPCTDSRFMAWALMRSPGAHLRSECPNLPTCSHENQPCRGHSLIGMAV